MGAGVGSGVAAVAGVSVGAAVAAGCATAGGSVGIAVGVGAGAAPPDGPPFVGSVLAPQASNAVINTARMATSRYFAGLEPAVVFALIGNPLADAGFGNLPQQPSPNADAARRRGAKPC